MEPVYEWIRNLTGYFLFMSVLDNLLPGKKYGKYIRLFSGVVLILIVLQPFLGRLRIEDQIARMYETFDFQYQVGDLKQELLGVEQQRLKQMIAQYEQAVAQDVTQMAETLSWSVRECRVEIDAEEGTEKFGTVTGVWVVCARGKVGATEAGQLETGQAEPGQLESGQVEGGQTGGTQEAGSATAKVNEVRDVEIRVTEASQESSVGYKSSAATPETSAQAAELRRKIASYYHLEERYVEIRILEEKG